jgi:hypothetical protein
MKNVPCFLALILLGGSLGTARADTADFQFKVQDPTPPPTLTETLVYANTPFTVTMAPCQLGEAAQGCFYGLNESGQTLTTLDIGFDNSIGSAPNDFLNSQPADCVTNFGGSAFSTATCGLDPGDKTYDLLFSGTPGITPNEVFTLEELGPNPDAFQGGNAIAIATAMTPEPGSIVLTFSGTLLLGFLLLRRRQIVSTSLG